ncbi:MAG: hypothetical protein E7163_03780 [Firmicutes bacterium]|nr:hypothetical protein [Bacillota bacterium]
MKYEESLLIFLTLFIIIFIVDYFFINKRKLKLLNNNGTTKKGKKKKVKNISEIDYLVAKFKLDKRKLNKENMILWISIINSFIISIVSSVIIMFPFKIMWQLLIAFVLLFGLIYSLYEIYGSYLKRKEDKK